MNKQHLAIGLLLAALVLTATAFAGAPQARAVAGPTSSAPQTGPSVYFPLVLNSYPPVLFGRVTQAGVPASGIPIGLRFYNGSTWTTLATVTTDATGAYLFANMPGLSAGQKYLAAFDNTAQSDGRLAWWNTQALTVYTTGTTIQLGDFDLAAIALDQPAAGGAVGLPATFRWVRRAASSSDTYAVRLYDGSDGNPLFVSADLGYADNFTLSSVPGGFGSATAYTWDVVVRSPNGGWGASRQTRLIKLMPGLFGRVTQSGGAVGGVLLQARYFNGTAWSTRATATTADDGTYLFAGLPSLSAGQQYYVRYQNVNQTDDRLFLWSTRSLTGYTAGSSVDLGSFDIADIPLVNPPAGATIGLPYTFQWTRRPATTADSYLVEVYGHADFTPRWLSPLVGYGETHLVGGLPAGFKLFEPYAWDVVVVSPDGGTGVSRLARIVTFTSGGAKVSALTAQTWPAPEPMPERPGWSFDTGR